MSPIFLLEFWLYVHALSNLQVSKIQPCILCKYQRILCVSLRCCLEYNQLLFFLKNLEPTCQVNTYCKMDTEVQSGIQLAKRSSKIESHAKLLLAVVGVNVSSIFRSSKDRHLTGIIRFTFSCRSTWYQSQVNWTKNEAKVPEKGYRIIIQSDI